jgi:exopolysaccharide biosynthesis polyprenyl glycosylphosphotransferase
MAAITNDIPREPALSGGPHTDIVRSLTPVDDIQVIPDGQPGDMPGLPGTSPRLWSEGTGPARSGSWPSGANSLRRHLVAGDILALVAAWGTPLVVYGNGRLGRQAACAAIGVIVTVTAMRRAGLYRSRVCALRSLEAVRVLTSSIIGTSAFIAFGALIGPVDVTAAVGAGAAAVLAVLLLRWRFSRWLKARRAASRFLRTVVMVGTNADAEELWTLVNEEPELGFRVGGVAGPAQLGAPWGGLPACQEVDRVVELAGQTGANGIIVVASALDASARSEAVERALAAGLHVQIWPGIRGLSSRRTRIVPVAGIPLLYVEPQRVAPWQLVVKRAMDVVIAAGLAVATAPLLAVAALAVKMADGGPVIYRSPRVGRLGTPIQVLKLRTMVPDAAQLMAHVAELNQRKGGPLFKASEDPRVTKVGRILRATSIDELPQLWNVLNGTMSMVGPRPALLDEVERFDQQLHRRHEMRPGITGLWQVEARDNPSFSAYRRYDLSYVDNWSLGLDVAILTSTVHELTVRAIKALVALAAAPKTQTEAPDLRAARPLSGPN